MPLTAFRNLEHSTMIETAIKDYLHKYGFEALHLKAVLFDMDGVLFNSMPYHSKSWMQTAKHYNFKLSKEETYMFEGRTGKSTINILTNRSWHRDATDEEVKNIYATKSSIFNTYPPAERMPGALELLLKIRAEGFQIILVTGSGQKSLLARLGHNFPDIFHPDTMVTSFDVKHGKPNAEPYLKGLAKAAVKPWEAIVVENAPMGVKAGVTANIFTVALNTGVLKDEALLGEGANVLFHSMQKFCDKWEEVKNDLQ